MSRNRSTDGNTDAMFFMLKIAAAVFAVCILFLGRFAAVRGASYRTVWWLTLPAAFLFGHIFAVCLTIVIGFCLILISHDLGNWLFSNAIHLMAFGIGDAKINGFTVIMYQVIVWKLVVSKLNRNFALSVYDWAIQSIGYAEGTHPYYVRQDVSKNDPGYAKAEAIYLKSGNPPLLGLVLVALAGTPVIEYYGDHACYN